MLAWCSLAHALGSKLACARGASQRLIARAAVVSKKGGVQGGTRVLSCLALPQFGASRSDGRGWQQSWGKRWTSGTVAAAIAAVLLSDEPRAVLAQESELQGRADQFGGVLIDHKTLPTSVRAFDEQLASALGQWRAAGKKGIWLKLKPAHAVLLATAYG